MVDGDVCYQCSSVKKESRVIVGPDAHNRTNFMDSHSRIGRVLLIFGYFHEIPSQPTQSLGHQGSRTDFHFLLRVLYQSVHTIWVSDTYNL